MIDGKEFLKNSYGSPESNWQWAEGTLMHALDFLDKCDIHEEGKFVAQVRYWSTMAQRCILYDKHANFARRTGSSGHYQLWTRMR